MDLIIIALIVALIVYLVRKNKKKQKSAGAGSGGVIDTQAVGGSSSGAVEDHSGFSPKGGASAPVGNDDDASQFRFGSDDDFAAALGALTDEKPVSTSTPKPVVMEDDAPQGTAATPTGTGVVRCKINGKYDLEGTSARFENGKVYGLSAQGEYLIGSYNAEVTEVRNTRDEIIGRIDGNLIILTREGQVERLKAQGREKTPDELVLLCAERFSSKICSTENAEELALCSSDDRACAAAFICLHYDGDGIGPKESELHRFWYSWM